MLHVGLLPHHKQWGDFLANLGWVVVDEAHTYRGVFGSHVANVLRRLRRAARAYGSEPRFLMASATIANPGELAERLTGCGVPPHRRRRGALGRPRDRDLEPAPDRRGGGDAALGALGGGRPARRPGLPWRAHDLLSAQPPRDRADPALHPRPPRGRREGRAREADRALPGRLHTAAAARDRGRAGGRGAARRGRHRRAGARHRHRRARCRDLRHLPRNRRQPAPDVGAGRAGAAAGSPSTSRARTPWTSSSPAIPDEFLGRPVEAAILDHASEQISAQHLIAAAYELPLTDEDEEIFGAGWRERAEALVSAGELRASGNRFLPRRSGFPASRIPLRSASADSVTVIERESGELLGLVEAERAFTTVHPGAIYLHMGRSYEVERLDVEARRAVVAALRRRLLHPAQEGDRHLHRADSREPRDRRRGAVARRGLGDRAGDRLPARQPQRPRADRHRLAGAAGAELPHPGALVRAAAGDRRRAAARGPARGAARRPSTARSRCCR